MIHPNQATVTTSRTTTVISGAPDGSSSLSAKHVDTVPLSEVNRGLMGPKLTQSNMGTGVVQPALIENPVQSDMEKYHLESGVGSEAAQSDVGTDLAQPGVGTSVGTDLTINELTRGTFVFKPIEARLNHDHDLFGNMDPYCKVQLGWHKGRSTVAKKQGLFPVWVGEMISLKRKHGEQFAKLKVKDKDRLKPDDRVGKCKIPLDEIATKGKVSQWYPLTKRGKPAGEVFLEIEYFNHA